MIHRIIRCRSRVLALAATLAVSACGGGGGDDGGTASLPVDPSSPPPAADININIDNPTLVLVDNAPATAGGGLDLVWSDEFDASQLDPEVWFFERGDGSQYGIPGWGNNELQYYLEDSARLENGLLVITAREEDVGGKRFTSARINTRDRFAFRYGRVEARMRLPGGQGLWPAFWLLPQDDVYGGWAASGEIDIMEAVNLGGAGGNNVHGTIHFGGAWPDNQFTGSSYLVSTDATAEFHTYALEWDPNELRWYVDDVLFAMQNAWSTTGGPYPAPFDQPFYLLLNVAVGGNFPGAPESPSAATSRARRIRRRHSRRRWKSTG
jgi:beta-glucanase (GH16 family)